MKKIKICEQIKILKIRISMLNKHLLRSLASILFLVLMETGCNTTTQNQQAKAPIEKYLYTNSQLQNEKYRSSLSIPVEISINDIAKQMNLQVNGLIYEDNSFEDDGHDDFKTKVWKRAPIVVEARDSLLYYKVPLKVWAEKAYRIGPINGSQDTNFEIDIKFVTSIKLSPNWQMITQTASAGFDWITKPSIRVAGIEIPIAGLVSRKMNENLQVFSKVIDENVKQNFEIKKYVIQAWNQIREPRQISGQYKTWLTITPTDALTSPFIIEKNRIYTAIHVKGYTQTTTGSKPNITPVTDIPALQPNEPNTTGFQIGLMASLPFTEATQFVAQEFVGKKYSFDHEKYNVEVTQIDIYGQNDKLIIKAGLKGSINGNIYLKGIPYYDIVTRTLSLKNLDYDLDTRNVLIKTANWLLQGKFIKMMEKQFMLPIGSQIDDAQKNIQQQLTNRQIARGMTLNGKLNSLQPDQVYLTETSLTAVVFVKGEVELKINGLF